MSFIPCPRCAYEIEGATDAEVKLQAERDSLRSRLQEVERERDAWRSYCESAERERDQWQQSEEERFALQLKANKERDAALERAAEAEAAYDELLASKPPSDATLRPFREAVVRDDTAEAIAAWFERGGCPYYVGPYASDLAADIRAGKWRDK